MNKDLVLVNGEIVNANELFVPFNDRAHQMGDGVFEVVPVYNGRVFAMIPHMENLFVSATKLKIPAVYMVEELVEFHERLIEATGMVDGEIYTQVSRGVGDYRMNFPEMSIPQLVMQPVEVDREILAQKQETGVNLVTEKDIRWQYCSVNTLNRLPEVLARQKAQVSNAYDALFVRDGKVTETTESCFMIVKDGLLWTAPENEFVHNNITRRLIKEYLAKQLDLQVIERSFDLEFAIKAEEAFICGPRCEILPVTKIDRKFIGEGTVGNTVRELIAAYKEFVARECPAR